MLLFCIVLFYNTLNRLVHRSDIISFLQLNQRGQRVVSPIGVFFTQALEKFKRDQVVELKIGVSGEVGYHTRYIKIELVTRLTDRNCFTKGILSSKQLRCEVFSNY